MYGVLARRMQRVISTKQAHREPCLMYSIRTLNSEQLRHFVMHWPACHALARCTVFMKAPLERIFLCRASFLFVLFLFHQATVRHYSSVSSGSASVTLPLRVPCVCKDQTPLMVTDRGRSSAASKKVRAVHLRLSLW